MKALASRFERILDDSNPQDLATTCWALNVVNELQDRRFICTICARVLPDIAAFNVLDLANIMSSVSSAFKDFPASEIPIVLAFFSAATELIDHATWKDKRSCSLQKPWLP